MNTTPVHPVDEKLPTGRLVALGLQHVLVMYAGADRAVSGAGAWESLERYRLARSSSTVPPVSA